MAVVNTGFKFQKEVDGVKFRVFYTKHFVDRYETGDPSRGRFPVKKSVDESVIEAKITEALDQISEISYGDPDAQGVIASHQKKFVMLFALVRRENGFQINMITTSPGLNFKAKSPSDYVIKVNPVYDIVFTSPISYGLKVSILADIAENAADLEDGGLFHMGDSLIDYWVERSGFRFHILQADWAAPVYEVQVS